MYSEQFKLVSWPLAVLGMGAGLSVQEQSWPKQLASTGGQSGFLNELPQFDLKQHNAVR